MADDARTIGRSGPDDEDELRRIDGEVGTAEKGLLAAADCAWACSRAARCEKYDGVPREVVEVDAAGVGGRSWSSFESANSNKTRAFCAVSSRPANTRSSSGSTATGAVMDRGIGFLAEVRRTRMPSLGLPKILSDDKLLIALARAVEGLPTNASGEPGKRSTGYETLRGDEERYESGRGEDDIEYGW